MDAPTGSLTLDQPNADALPDFTHQQIVRVMIGIMFCIMLAAIDMTVVVPAVPAIAADLNGFGHLSWIVSAYLLTSTAATPIYGKLSDVYGRRALLTVAIVVFIITSLLCGLSQTLTQLIAFRALQGLGGAGLMAIAQTVVADVVAPRERGRYQAYLAGSWGVASVFGPILGGWMTDYLSWRWIFWINLPIGLLALFLSYRALRLLKNRRSDTRIDYIGAALLAALSTTLLLVMSWGGTEYAWDSREVVWLSVVSVLLLALLIWRERSTSDPLLPPRLFANSVIALGVLLAFLGTAAMLGGIFLLPLYFQLERGVGASASGTLMMPFLAVNAVGAYISGQFTRRYGSTKPVVLGGMAGSTLGFLLIASMDAHTSTALVLLYTCLVGLSIGVYGPATMVIVQNAAERRDVGAVTGALLFLRSIGGAFGSTLGGALLVGVFSAGLAAQGVTRSIDLGELRGSSANIDQLDAATRLAARTALESGFHVAFLSAAVLCGLAVLVGLVIRDLPLQSSAGKKASS